MDKNKKAIWDIQKVLQNNTDPVTIRINAVAVIVERALKEIEDEKEEEEEDHAAPDESR